MYSATYAVLTVPQVLKTSVNGQIRQLSLSPLGDYLAIATSHTVHIAILPTSFDAQGAEPIKLRTFQLGPTAHVLEQAAVIALLWHPLGSLGSCLVTVAADACVRLWELNPDSRHSFDEPALALDLKKLANAASTGEDLRASVYGTSKGFSPDSVEMEVAAAGFGGVGCPEEHGWSPMTLWVAMTEGDIYALCPFLPSKWQPAKSTITSLLTDVVAKAAILDDDEDAADSDRRNASRQQEWLSNIDAQDPAIVTLPGSYESVEVYTRPASPAAIPKLQGPFRVTPEVELDEIADLLVIAPRDAKPTEHEQETEVDDDRAELSVGLICLLTKKGKVHICLDINDIEAQWLPAKKTHFQKTFDMESKNLDLVLLETIETVDENAAATWPSFTPLVNSRYTANEPLYKSHTSSRYQFMVTSASSVVSCSLAPWLNDLEDELCGPLDGGSQFRAGLLYESDKSHVEQIITIPNNVAEDAEQSASACISLLDSDLGQFVLSVIRDQPYATSLELPPHHRPEVYAPDDDMHLQLPGLEPREPYQPHPSFFAQSTLAQFIESLTQSGGTRLKRADMKSHVRLSPASLHLLTEAHRVLSSETSKLGVAAADLFRRCQRMKAELAEQISRVNELASRVDSITGMESSDSGKDKVDTRMAKASDRAQQLKQRVDTLRKRMGGLGGKELSKREEAWAVEVKTLDRSLSERTEDEQSQGPTAQRFETIQRIGRGVIGQANQAAKVASENAQSPDKDDQYEEKDEVASKRGSMYGNDFRKQKLQHVMALLERETALVDAVTERLERLSGLAA